MQYGGAPDECGYHFVWGDKIVRLDEKGECPLQSEHTQFGPAAG